MNNAVYHSYIEQARCQFFQDNNWFEPSKGISHLPLILARTEMDFLKPAFFPDTLQVETWVSKIGNKSFVMDYEVISKSNKLAVVRASSTLVWFDYESNCSVRVPDSVKQKLKNFL